MLKALEKTENLSKRKELWSVRKSGATCTTFSTGRGNKQFAQDTADATGVSKRAVNIALSRAKNVTEEVRDEIRGTDLDKGTVLDDLKRVAPERQMDRLFSLGFGHDNVCNDQAVIT